MPNDNFIEKLASQFGQNASVKNVFGEPVIAGDKTIIPVARIAYGLGGGSGQGMKKKMPIQSSETPADATPMGEGSGGGGGLHAVPKGVYEITPAGTRFIPANNAKQLLLGFAIGLIVRGWLFAKRKH